jgi:heme-degrading monooxygenase HmoA
VLVVRPGAETEFEAAFADASKIISSTKGFLPLGLHRCIERGSHYLLLVEWESLEGHTEGFRREPEYDQWRSLLHHFYDPFPTVEHFELKQRLTAEALTDSNRRPPPHHSPA